MPATSELAARLAEDYGTESNLPPGPLLGLIAFVVIAAVFHKEIAAFIKAVEEIIKSIVEVIEFLAKNWWIFPVALVAYLILSTRTGS